MEAVLEETSSAEPENEFRRRRWYHRRDLRFLGLILAFVAVFYSYGYVTGPAKITGDLASVIEKSDARVNIEVEANFPPEAFHMSIYQKVGSVRGSKGSVTTLFRILPQDIQMLSRKYWVKSIRLAPPSK